MTWTGSEVVVWGGSLEAFNMGFPELEDALYSDGAAFNPTTNAWRPMAPSPLPGAPDDVLSVWDGDEVIVVAGGRTAAWNPVSDSWRLLSDVPSRSPIDEYGHLATAPFGLVWSGDDVFLADPTGLYRLGDESWDRVPDPRVELSDGGIDWTGSEIIVTGSTVPPQSGASDLEGGAYDPRSGEWRRLPPSGLSAQAADTEWNGRELVAVNYDMTAAAYDPDADRWRQLPNLPLTMSECGAHVLNSGGAAIAVMCSGTAVLDGSGRWTPLPPTGAQIAADGILYGLDITGNTGATARLVLKAAPIVFS